MNKYEALRTSVIIWSHVRDRRAEGELCITTTGLKREACVSLGLDHTTLFNTCPLCEYASREKGTSRGMCNVCPVEVPCDDTSSYWARIHEADIPQEELVSRINDFVIYLEDLESMHTCI